MLSVMLGLLALALARLPTAAVAAWRVPQWQAPPPCAGPLKGTAVCDAAADPSARAAALAGLLTVQEKSDLMSTGGAGGGAGAGLSRLGIPGFPTGEGLHGVAIVVGETSVILLHPPLPLVGVPIAVERERQQ